MNLNFHYKLPAALLFFVIVSSAFGSIPTFVKLGPISLSGIITLLIPIFTLILFINNPKISRSIWLPVIALFIFWVLSIASLLGLYPAKELTVRNYPAVWGGMLFLLLIFSTPMNLNISFIKTVNKILSLASYLYILVILYLGLFSGENATTALAGLLFFFYHLAKYEQGKHSSLLFMVAILTGHILVEARIVYVTEVLILLIRPILLYGIRKVLSPKFLLLCIISTFMIVLFGSWLLHSGYFSNSFAGGDQALVINGVHINTSGRVGMWQVIIESWLNRPMLGYGIPGPPEMLEIPRWSHPHNDYLRILHQFGIVGLVLFLTFLLSLIKRIKLVLTSANLHKDSKVIVMTAYFSSLALLCVMFTDNAIVYSYVVYPIMSLLGLSINIMRMKEIHN